MRESSHTAQMGVFSINYFINFVLIVASQKFFRRLIIVIEANDHSYNKKQTNSNACDEVLNKFSAVQIDIFLFPGQLFLVLLVVAVFLFLPDYLWTAACADELFMHADLNSWDVNYLRQFSLPKWRMNGDFIASPTRQKPSAVFSLFTDNKWWFLEKARKVSKGSENKNNRR